MPLSKQIGHAVQRETSRSSSDARRSTGCRARDLLASSGAIRGSDRQTRPLLCHLINSNIERQVTQAVAANLLEVNPPKISTLAHYATPRSVHLVQGGTPAG